MFQFVGDNLLLVFTIIGAIISFLASFIGVVSQKKPVQVLAVLAVLGFAVGIAYQISAYNVKQDAARRATAMQQIEQAAKKARDNVISEINFTVEHTKITVDAIAKQLSKSTMKDVATELVSIRDRGNIDFEETAAFAKGSPEMWNTYEKWLRSSANTAGAPSLSLTVNADHHYDSGLILAYLLTSGNTRNILNGVVSSHSEWHRFNAEELYFKAFSAETSHLGWVLFYDITTPHPVAYAEADTFAQELMVYHRLKQHGKIDQLLNSNGVNTISELQKAFPSIQTAVFASQSPGELVKLMIDRQLSVSVTSVGNKPYVAELVRMIQLAAESN